MTIVYKQEEEKREKTAAGFTYKYTPAKICIVFHDDKKTEVNFYASYFAKCVKKVNAIENAKNEKEKKKAIKEFTEKKTLARILEILGIRINSFAVSLSDAEEAYCNEVFEGIRAAVNYLLAEENAKAEKKAKKKAVEPVVDEVEEKERVAAKMEKMNPFEKLIFVKLYNAGLTA